MGIQTSGTCDNCFTDIDEYDQIYCDNCFEDPNCDHYSNNAIELRIKCGCIYRANLKKNEQWVKCYSPECVMPEFEMHIIDDFIVNVQPSPETTLIIPKAKQVKQ